MGKESVTSSIKTVREPLPSPGPVRAEARLEILRARRPRLSLDDPRVQTPEKAAERKRAARAELLEKYGPEFWEAKKLKIKVRKNLATFIRESWHILEPGNALHWNWHIDVICDALERVSRGEITRLLINIPPGHMKSWIVSVAWPAWVWLEDPGWRSLFASYSQELSDELSRNCRRLVESDWYQAQIPQVYGPRWNRPWHLAPDANNVRVYKTEVNGGRRATSIDGAGTGFRGDCVVIDDPHNVSEHVTPESLDKVVSWYDKRMSSRFNDMTSGRIVVIMQRVHENDLSGHILKQDAANAGNPHWTPFEHICLRSEYDATRPNKYDQRTEPGALLFETKFPRREIEIAKIKLGAQYSAQHDQDPIPAGGGIIPMASLRFWIPERAPDDWGSRPWPPAPHQEKLVDGTLAACAQHVIAREFSTELQSWDCTFKDTAKSDFVAGTAWAAGVVPHAARIYMREQIVNRRMGLHATIAAVRELRAAYPASTMTLIEAAANGHGVIETLEDELMGVVPVPPVKGKEERAWAIEPAVRAGNVYLPHPAVYPEVHTVLHQLRAFPKGHHDDLVDSVTQAVQALMQRGGAWWDAMGSM